MRLLRSLAMAGLCFTPLMASAQIGNDLNSFYDSMRMDGNVTSPKAWKGQSAGYLTGGSVFARTGVRNVQLVSMQLPDIKSGCGGIDAYLGSFSFISGDEIQRFVKQIMSNAAGYAFDLALQTAIPEMKATKDFLQKLASDVNSSNLSSCQAAEGIVGGLWPQTQVSQRKICQDIAGDQNLFSDWAASRQGCTIEGDGAKVLGKAKGAQKDQVLRNTNLMWDVLSNRSLMFADDDISKAYVMTLTGTIIFDADGNATVVPPLAGRDDIISILLKGGESLIYTCDNNEKCMKVSTGTLKLTESSSLHARVTKTIENILSKSVGDSSLSVNEQNFINSTNVKVLSYAFDAQSLGIMESQLVMLSDYIAFDILLKFLRDMLDQVDVGISVKNFPEEQRAQVRNNLRMAYRKVNELQSSVKYREDALARMDRSVNYMRQQLSSGMLTKYRKNYSFEAK